MLPRYLDFARLLRLGLSSAGSRLVYCRYRSNRKATRSASDLKAALAVGLVHGGVEFLVGLEQYGRHAQRIVKIGERGVGELRACVQHSLRGGFDGLALRVAGVIGPGEVVIDDAGGITISAFQSPTGVTHPGVVHGAFENTEMENGRRPCRYKQKVAR